MKKLLFLFAIALIAALFLTGCQKDIATLTPETNTTDELYLKSAGAGEVVMIKYIKDGQIDSYSSYNDVLFAVSGSKAKILDRTFLEVKKFELLGNNQASFSVGEIGSETNIESVYASKLPFKSADYGLQTKTGDARFYGVLKAKNFVLAVKEGQTLVYDLDAGGDKITATKVSIFGDTLTFNIGLATWTLKFVATTPIGNIFELSAVGKTFICCNIS